MEAFKPGQEGLAPSGKVNIHSGKESVSIDFLEVWPSFPQKF